MFNFVTEHDLTISNMVMIIYERFDLTEVELIFVTDKQLPKLCFIKIIHKIKEEYDFS